MGCSDDGKIWFDEYFWCPRESDVQAVKDAIERVDLTDHLSTPIGNLSGGQENELFS